VTTKFKVPKDQAMGSVKWLWDEFWKDGGDLEPGVSILEDLPTCHTKQLVNFFHYLVLVGDRALTRSDMDDYEESEGVT